jgi:hypothetical protein
LRRVVRFRPAPATVIALIALFVALGGTSYATFAVPKNSIASPQVINGSLQTVDLSQRTRAALKGSSGQQGPQGLQGVPGAQGFTGPQGVQGAPGAPGATGPQGATGPKGDTGSQGPKGDTGAPGGVLRTLPSGESESGAWATGDSTSGEYLAINFPIPLASGLPAANLHFMGLSTSAACPGAGQAAAGHLCVYAGPGRNHLTFFFFDDPINGSADSNAAPFGVNMYLYAGASTDTAGGSWTVTAP